MGTYDNSAGYPLHDPAFDGGDYCDVCEKSVDDCTCIECPKCGKLSQVNDNHECPHCRTYYDVCTSCRMKLPVIDDCGICLCQECLDANPLAQSILAKHSREEDE